jgi:hypothetical protein
VEAIEMSDYQVIVTEDRYSVLVGTDVITYISPPQTEQQARALITLLADAAVDGAGPWRHPVAGGQRTIELRPAGRR